MSKEKTRLPEGFIPPGIELLLWIEKTGSFTEAGNICGLNQSTVSKRLKELENTTQCELVSRASRPVTLTSEGRRIAEFYAPFYEDLHSLISEIRDKSNLRQRLRIGIVDSFTYNIAPLLLSNISPMVSGCLCRTGTSNNLLKELAANKLDVVISSDQGSDLKDVRRRFFYGEPSVLAMPKEYIDRQKDWTWAQLQLSGIPYIGLTRESGGGKLSETFLVSHGITLRSYYEFDNTGLLLRLVHDGKGWTIARPAALIENRIQEPVQNHKFY